MTKVNTPLDAQGFKIPWGSVVGVLLLLAAGAYAAQHPHSLIYYLIKFLIAP